MSEERSSVPKAHEVKFLTTAFEIRNAIRRGDWNNHDRFYATCSALEVACDEIERLKQAIKEHLEDCPLAIEYHEPAQ